MGHPGLLVQDYIAGIPIWYIPNTEILDLYVETPAAGLPEPISW
jgi:hypothetical protein